MLAILGANSFNAPILTNTDYLELVDFTRRMVHPGKPGVIKQTQPRALTKLGLDPNHWTSKVKGIGKSYWRLVAEVEDLIELAAQWQQRTVYGVGFARRLINR